VSAATPRPLPRQNSAVAVRKPSMTRKQIGEQLLKLADTCDQHRDYDQSLEDMSLVGTLLRLLAGRCVDVTPGDPRVKGLARPFYSRAAVTDALIGAIEAVGSLGMGLRARARWWVSAAERALLLEQEDANLRPEIRWPLGYMGDAK